MATHNEILDFDANHLHWLLILTTNLTFALEPDLHSTCASLSSCAVARVSDDCNRPALL